LEHRREKTSGTGEKWLHCEGPEGSISTKKAAILGKKGDVPKDALTWKTCLKKGVPVFPNLDRVKRPSRREAMSRKKVGGYDKRGHPLREARPNKHLRGKGGNLVKTPRISGGGGLL